MKISEEDKEMIYSLYVKGDEKFTFEGIATLYTNKYPGITADTVENITRVKHDRGDEMIIFDKALRLRPLTKSVKVTNDLQRDRKKNDEV
ncbi:hypothetical protein [Clostridium sp.]|uniref:hypothetical protein n=1 Tax=Clostridium sp. TaxID=1506 RepID=UPI0035A06AFA